MIVFILMAAKITATLFSISNPSLISFSAISIPMLLVWSTDDSSTELFAFRSIVWFALFALCFIMWIVTPWLTTSKKDPVAIVGLASVIGLNVFDVVSCILSALPTLEKTFSLSFSALIILLSIRAIYKMWESSAT